MIEKIEINLRLLIIHVARFEGIVLFIYLAGCTTFLHLPAPI